MPTQIERQEVQCLLADEAARLVEVLAPAETRTSIYLGRPTARSSTTAQTTDFGPRAVVLSPASPPRSP